MHVGNWRIVTSATFGGVVGGAAAWLALSYFHPRLVGSEPVPLPVAARSTLVPVCQVARFWTPDSAASGLRLQEAAANLHNALTGKFGGWTRWRVQGRWMDPEGHHPVDEDGYFYEVSLPTCEERPVAELFATVQEYVKDGMQQSALYFTVTPAGTSP